MVMAAFVLVVTMLASPLPAAAASKGNKPVKVVPGNGKGGSDPFDPVNIAKFLAKQAAIKFADLALDKSGVLKLISDRTTLDDLAGQIQGVSNQVRVLQQSTDQIQRDLAKVLLNQFAIPLTALVSSVQSLFLNQFLPTIEALVRYADAVPDGNCDDTTSKCGKARVTFEDTLAGFMDAAARTESDNITIHNFILPSSAGSSVLSAYGAFLMRGEGATGLLTSTDSDRLLAFYNYYAQWEALATLMQSERNTVRYANLPGSMDNFINIQVTGFQKLETDSLPAPIPTDAVISLPVTPGLRTSTKNQLMWNWNYRVGPNLAWDPSTAPSSAPLAPGCSRVSGANRCTVAAAINTYNQTAAGLGFTDWRVPSRADWDRFLTGQFDQFPKDLRLFLLGFWRFGVQGAALDQSLQTSPLVWTSDMAQQPSISCHLSGSGIGDAGKVVPVAHTALGTGGSLRNYPAAFPLVTVPQVSTAQLQYPRGLTQSQGLAWCRQQLVSMVTAGFVTPNAGGAAASANLIAARTTTVNYMP
jgi:hypothetical protein